MKWALALALGLLCSLGLVLGCGGDDEKKDTTGATAPAGETTTPGGSAETINVTETDFEIEPANPTVKAGAVNFKVTNKGKVEHNLEVEAPSGEVELAENLQPGDSGTLEVNLDKAGSYEWYCPVGNHRDLGMEGEVRVTGGGTNTTGTTTTGTTTTGTTETQTTETQTTETNEDSSGNSGSGGGGSGSGGSGSGGGY